MSNSLADSRVRLEWLLELANQETDPVKYDEILAEISRALDEALSLRSTLEISKQPEGEDR